MASIGGANIVTEGLVLCLDAANRRSYPGSGTVWSDLSGNNNSGSLTNGPTFSSDNYGAIVFDGTNDHVNMGSLNLQQNWTLETFCNMTNDTDFGIFGQGIGVLNQGLHIIYQSGARGMIYGMYSNDNDYQNNYRTTINVWNHWVFTYNNSTFTKQFYANTILQTPGASVQNQYQGSGQFNVAGAYSSASSPANGKFAIARMYNRVLSASEILQNYNGTKSRYGL